MVLGLEASGGILEGAQLGMLASWRALKMQEDALRTRSWADFGLRFNVEPGRSKLRQ
jgi:hypothetical protein